MEFIAGHVGDVPAVLGNDAAIGFGRIVDDGMDDVEVSGLAGSDHRVRRSVLRLSLVEHFLAAQEEWNGDSV